MTTVSERPDRRIAAGANDDFADVTTWIFDLDGTLYPAASGVERELLRRVVLFLAERLQLSLEAAAALHRDYFERFGATITAVKELHGIAPSEFIDFVHDIDLSCLAPDLTLAAALEALPGRKLVFTNGSRRHADGVLGALGLISSFEAVCHIESCDFIGKPQAVAYDRFVTTFGVDPERAAMFDDRAANLVVPRELGMRTILVLQPDADRFDPDVAGHATDDLVGFLSGLAN